MFQMFSLSVASDGSNFTVSVTSKIYDFNICSMVKCFMISATPENFPMDLAVLVNTWNSDIYYTKWWMGEAINITHGDKLINAQKQFPGSVYHWELWQQSIRADFAHITHKKLSSWKGHICAQITLIIFPLSDCWNSHFSKVAKFWVRFYYSIGENLSRISRIMRWVVSFFMILFLFIFITFDHSIYCASIWCRFLHLKPGNLSEWSMNRSTTNL